MGNTTRFRARKWRNCYDSSQRHRRRFYQKQRPGTAINPVFAINGTDAPLTDTPRQFVLNLRVDDLDTFLEHLRGQNVPTDPEILVWERGKHAQIHDLDGNEIELYAEILVGE